jgi:acetylornithine deacetylase/succinyl-diaminopimelate desuccinylase-like protein
LTPGLSLEEVRTGVEAHLKRLDYTLVDGEPTTAQRLAHPQLAHVDWGERGYNSAMAELDNIYVQRVIAVMRAATKNEVRVAPIMGGSLPIAPIGEVLGTPFVIVPIVNADNNQHAPNENLRMREFRRGIELYAALLAEMGAR